MEGEEGAEVVEEVDEVIEEEEVGGVDELIWYHSATSRIKIEFGIRASTRDQWGDIRGRLHKDTYTRSDYQHTAWLGLKLIAKRKGMRCGIEYRSVAPRHDMQMECNRISNTVASRSLDRALLHTFWYE